MTVTREETTEIFDDIIISDYIRTSSDEFRLTQTYIGAAMIEDDEPRDIYDCMGCIIEVHEITANNPHILPAIAQKLNDDGIETETYTDYIYDTYPAPRLTISTENYNSYDSTQSDIDRILELLKAFD